MPVRVSATDRIRTRIDELFAQGRELPEILDDAARLGAQLLIHACDHLSWPQLGRFYSGEYRPRPGSSAWAGW